MYLRTYDTGCVAVVTGNVTVLTFIHSHITSKCRYVTYVAYMDVLGTEVLKIYFVWDRTQTCVVALYSVRTRYTYL